MNTIYFAVLRQSKGQRSYSEKEYKIAPDKYGINKIMRVHCWNGIHDIEFTGIQINVGWVNEFPKGVIESKMWCDKTGLKTAKSVLEKQFDDFLKEKNK